MKQYLKDWHRGRALEIAGQKCIVVTVINYALAAKLMVFRMIVGVMTTQLHLPGIGSLKQKRSIVKSLIGRLQSRFNISISEVDHQDNKRSAVIGISLVSNEARFVNQQMDKILGFMRADGRFYLGPVERETF